MGSAKKYFYKDKPLFGLDIGFSSIKAMQLELTSKGPKLIGYGIGSFDSKAMKDGEVVDFELLAQATHDLFKNKIVGEITTRRVAMGIPATLTYTHTINLPILPEDEIAQAVELESEQYLPIPISELYIDYVIVGKTDKNIEVLTVAVPKRIADSYLALMRMLGLEAVSFDSSIGASGRLFEMQEQNSEIPAVLIDFGTVSADITIHEKTNIVSSTVPAGGDIFTDLITKGLKVTRDEAKVIKTKYGIGKSKKQAEILNSIQPEMDKLSKELKRMIRYYEERSIGKNKIGQVITMGGGANMPGLSDYLTNMLRLPVRTLNPWQKIDLNHLTPPNQDEKSVYVTVTGLCLLKPSEVFGK